ncbi:MAG TPA: hypothetical protein VI913_02295, partial [Candidatus Peribacteraceae bacterium]|nr:hypothetical protein [Candidatus Peribacteraceae bacterium]
PAEDNIPEKEPTLEELQAELGQIQQSNAHYMQVVERESTHRLQNYHHEELMTKLDARRRCERIEQQIREKIAALQASSEAA